MPVSVSHFVSVSLWSCDIRGGISKQVELTVAVSLDLHISPSL